MAVAAAAAPAATPVATPAPRFTAPRVFAQGADASTAAAFELLLVQHLQRDVQDRMIATGNGGAGTGSVACAEPGCAAAQARRSGADAALLCTLARLGNAHVAMLAWVDLDAHIVWSHRLTADRPEDLDRVAERLAAAVTTGELPRAHSDTRRRPSEIESPRRGPRTGGAHRRAGDAIPVDGEPRKSLMSQGPRFGSVYPSGGSYAGVPRLMSFAWVWRHQTPEFVVEAVPVLGIAWGGSLDADGGEARDWSILDLFVSWSPIQTDIAPVVGAGIGLHGLRLQRDLPEGRRSDNTLGVSLAAGGGLVLFRSYDFQVAFDARYQVMLDRFTGVDGRGAHGFALTFGLQRR